MNYSLLSKYRSELMGLAMLWIMLFHAFVLVLPIHILDVLKRIGFGGVDIFILLSMMGLVCSLQKKPVSWCAFMKRRVIRILPTFYLVVIPYALWQYWIGDIPLSTVGWDISLLFYWVRAEGAFNWYIPGILLFYAATPFALKWMKPIKRPWIVLVCWTAASITLCQLLMRYGSWRYLDVAYRLPIFLIGIYVGICVSEKRSISRKEQTVWLLLMAVGLAYLFGQKYLPGNYTVCFTFIFTTVPTCLLIGLIFEKLRFLAPGRRFLRWLGESSLEIYLLNVSVFSQYNRLGEYFCFDRNWYSYFLLSFAANIALGIGLHQLLDRISKNRKNKVKNNVQVRRT